jgi:putative endonuclease
LNLGRSGERLAARWLERRGYRVLERNVRVSRDEADLVALDPDGETVVIVEVKTRRDAYLAPELRVDVAKERCLTRLAHGLRRRQEYARRPLRFDVVTVVWNDGGAPKVRHFPGAFDARY